MIEYLEWDSEFFGVRTGACRDIIETSVKLEGFIKEVKQSDLDLVYVTFSFDRFDLVTRILKEKGAVLTDIRAQMEMDLLRTPAFKDDHSLGSITVRIACSSEAKALGEIAHGCYIGQTRFYRDPNLPDSRCSEFYRTWTVRDVLDGRSLSLACIYGEKPAGFCTVSYDPGGNARIGLIGVSSDTRGHGIGHALLGHAAEILREDGCKRLTAVTQIASSSAVRMYERAGFLLKGASIVVHFWPRMEGKTG